MKYNIDNFKKIIELNKDLVNFYVKFDISSSDNKPFYMTIADISEEYDFKYVEEGKIDGDFTWNENEHREFYLVLKSEEPTEVNVTLQINDLNTNNNNKNMDENNMEMMPPQEEMEQQQGGHTGMDELFEEEDNMQQQMMQPQMVPQEEKPEEKSIFDTLWEYKYTILAVIVVSLAIFIYKNPELIEKAKEHLKLPETKLGATSIPSVIKTPKLDVKTPPIVDNIASGLDNLKV